MTDTERLDFLEREGYEIQCYWRDGEYAGGPRVGLYSRHDRAPTIRGETLREVIDIAAVRRSGEP